MSAFSRAAAVARLFLAGAGLWAHGAALPEPEVFRLGVR